MADATTFKNLAYILEAKALAMRVFPVPGGPYIRHPEFLIFCTLWRFYSDSFEKLGIGQRKLNGFP
jgi:hypothetical protein